VRLRVLKEWGLRFCSNRFGRLKARVRLAYRGDVGYGTYYKVPINRNFLNVGLSDLKEFLKFCITSTCLPLDSKFGCVVVLAARYLLHHGSASTRIVQA